MRVANFIEKLHKRREAARERRQLSDENRDIVDRVAVESFLEADGDPEKAIQIARGSLSKFGFDPSYVVIAMKVLAIIIQLLYMHKDKLGSPKITDIAKLCEDDKDA